MLMRIVWLAILALFASQPIFSMALWEKFKSMKNTTTQTAQFHANAIKYCHQENPELFKLFGLLNASQAIILGAYFHNHLFAVASFEALVTLSNGGILCYKAGKKYQKKLDTDLLIDAQAGCSLETIKQTFAEGAQVNCKGYDNKTPLIHILENYNKAHDPHSIAKFDAIARFLKTKGADLDDALRYLVQFDGNLSSVAWLLAHGANPNSQDKRSGPPLILAAIDNRIAYMKLLIRAGAKINALNENGVAALHCAATSGKLKAAAFLVLNGANINMQGYGRTTPISCTATMLWKKGDLIPLAQYLIYEGAELPNDSDSDSSDESDSDDSNSNNSSNNQFPVRHKVTLPEEARTAIINFTADGQNITKKILARACGKKNAHDHSNRIS